MSMRIGITMRVTGGGEYPEKRDVLSKDISEYIGKLLPEAVLIPLLNEADRANKVMRVLKINRVILSGGNDWGEDLKRDRTEKSIVQYCLKHKIPILGVCRGMQVLNILFGGKIRKNIRAVTREKHVGTMHTIELKKGLPFGKHFRGKKLRVNSFHNYGITLEDVSAKLKVFAKTEKGVVEGIYHPKKPIIGIQWHPERKNPVKLLDRQIVDYLFKRNDS